MKDKRDHLLLTESIILSGTNMKYALLYERMKEYKKEGPKSYLKYYSVRTKLYKRAVKMLQARGGKNPILKFYGYRKNAPQNTIIKKGLAIAKRTEH